MKPILVYLAGGMKSGWQNIASKACDSLRDEGINLKFFNPRAENSCNPEKFRPKNKELWEGADIIFGYIEPGNPAALPALCVEMAGGYYNGAITILVDGVEPVFFSSQEEKEKRLKENYHLAFLEAISHKIVNSLEGGIYTLKEVIWEKMVVPHAIN